MRRALLALACWPILTAGMCATPAPPPPAAAPILSVECLPLKAYSQAEQAALRTQLAGLPPDSPVQLAMLDYLRMRDADRACMGAR